METGGTVDPAGMTIFFHNSDIGGSHAGLETAAKIVFRFTWDNLLPEIEVYIRRCDICQTTKD